MISVRPYDMLYISLACTSNSLFHTWHTHILIHHSRIEARFNEWRFLLPISLRWPIRGEEVERFKQFHEKVLEVPTRYQAPILCGQNTSSLISRSPLLLRATTVRKKWPASIIAAL